VIVLASNCLWRLFSFIFSSKTIILVWICLRQAENEPKTALSLIRVFLLAKTMVLRNKRIQLLFKLKTTCIKILAPVLLTQDVNLPLASTTPETELVILISLFAMLTICTSRSTCLPSKNPFQMYSKSPHLPRLQKSAGATPLWSLWWWWLFLSTSTILYIQQQELTVMAAKQPLLEQPERDNLSTFPLASWAGRRTGPVFYFLRPLWCSL